MDKDHFEFRLILLALAILLLSACQALPVELLVQPAPTPTPEVFISLEQAGVGPNIMGQVVWGITPVPGAVVELRDGAWASDTAEVLRQATADAAGVFTITAAPVGEYGLVARWPDGGANMAAVTPVQITAGADLTDVPVRLAKQIILVEPPAGAVVESTPILRWQPLPGALTYRVMLIDAGTTELLLDERIEATEFTVPAALTSGRTYQWLAQGLIEEDVLLGEVDSTFTFVDTRQAATTSATDGSPQLSLDTGSIASGFEIEADRRRARRRQRPLLGDAACIYPRHPAGLSYPQPPHQAADLHLSGG